MSKFISACSAEMRASPVQPFCSRWGQSVGTLWKLVRVDRREAWWMRPSISSLHWKDPTVFKSVWTTRPWRDRTWAVVSTRT